MHNPTPSFAEEQISFSPLKKKKKKKKKKQLQSVDIFHFLNQFCAYIIKFLRSGNLSKMSMCHDAITRALTEFHKLSGAGIN